MGQRVPDTQCGYSLFSREVLPAGWRNPGRFAAESEMLAHAGVAGHAIGSVPVATIYGESVARTTQLTRHHGVIIGMLQPLPAAGFHNKPDPRSQVFMENRT